MSVMTYEMAVAKAMLKSWVLVFTGNRLANYCVKYSHMDALVAMRRLRVRAGLTP
jgi:hypothetical protein